MLIIKHSTSFIAPITLVIILPFIILFFESKKFSIPVLIQSPLAIIVGGVLLLSGSALFISALRLFLNQGNGTIMPWDPIQRLIITGPYRFVRNPMIASLILLLVGEGILFSSTGILILAGINFIVNTIYFITSEEPALEKRFGKAYIDYKKHVSRWVPRLKPWTPETINNVEASVNIEELLGGIPIPDENEIEHWIGKARPYTLVFLRKGPASREDEEQNKRLQLEHLQYLLRLQCCGKLVLNGPTLNEHDILGVSIYAADLEQACALAKADPKVKAGYLTVEAIPWMAVPAPGTKNATFF